MAKDYGRNRLMRRGNNGSKHFLMVLLAFLVGYLTASVFDFASLSHWVNTKLTAQQQNQAILPSVAAKKPSLPKPKFEFYTLLANGQTVVPNQKAVEKPVSIATGSKPQAPPLQLADNKKVKPLESLSAKESYIIQVGSFRTSPEAERMKASLILKGFSVRIMPISQAQAIWYRVIIGPYLNQNDAQKVQIAFAQKEHVKGMIRKI